MVATTTNLDIEPHRPGLDPFESATVTAFAGSCLTARDAIFGPDHLGLAARNLIRAQNKAKSFDVTLVGTWRCNRVDYTNLRFEVTPDAVGCYPDGHAYCRQQVDSQGGNRFLTDKARQTANELFAPYVLSAVQGQIDHIRDAMHKKVFEHLASQCDEFRRSAKALERALRYQTKIAGPLVWTATDRDREVEGWPC
tara:strand:- start:248 stop:835 length:588 start_codon:yes stop_codon:yes gene_type:complete